MTNQVKAIIDLCKSLGLDPDHSVLHLVGALGWAITCSDRPADMHAFARKGIEALGDFPSLTPDVNPRLS